MTDPELYHLRALADNVHHDTPGIVVEVQPFEQDGLDPDYFKVTVTADGVSRSSWPRTFDSAMSYISGAQAGFELSRLS